jgi:uncharacterized protein involved in exopolysaccharide biosynthesis
MNLSRQIDFQTLAALAASRWQLLVAATVVGGLGGFLSSLVPTKLYQSEVVISATRFDAAAVSTPFDSIIGTGFFPGLPLGDSERAKVEAVATLKSKAFTQDFIVRNELMRVLYSRMWDDTSKSWAVSEEDRPTLNDAVRLFDRKIRRVTEDKRTGLITLQIRWKDPIVAAEWATSLVVQLNRASRERALRIGQTNLNYLQDQLKKTSVLSVERALFGLVEAQIKSNAIAETRDEYAFRILDPAVVPDAKDFVFPQRPVFTFIGLLGGFLAGYALMLFKGRDRSSSGAAPM